MTEIKDVTGTAFIVAEFRADENAEAEPLYIDRIVPLFLNERTKAAADAISSGFPAAEENVRLRTRYFDDRLDAKLASGCQQIVILGAGLDTRAVRKQAPGVLYFEIDDANTLGFKKARLTENGIDPAAIFIPGDYVAEGVLALLEAHGFKRDAPAFFIWEGNTMYLTKADVMKVLTELARGVREFSISFDYMSEEVIAGPQSLSSASRPWARRGVSVSTMCTLWRRRQA